MFGHVIVHALDDLHCGTQSHSCILLLTCQFHDIQLNIFNPPC